MAQRIFNERIWTVGEHTELELRGFAPNTAGATVEFTRVGWPGTKDDTIGLIVAEFSLNDGVDWQGICGTGLPGGDVPARDGSGFATHSRLHCPWPEVGGQRLRGGDIRFILTVFQAFTSRVRLVTFNTNPGQP